jgi:TRAP-type C4-dicarboxylate transport system permease small subunit
MLIFRWLVMLLLLGGVLSFGMYVVTGEQRWRFIALGILKWTVFAALAFFGVLILERMVMIV